MSKVLQIESVKDTTLYKELLARSNEATKAFVANIPDLCEEAADRSKLIPKFFSEYTLHDKTHFLRVVELMAFVLGDTKNQLNDVEIGLLILAAFYHDQGMLIVKQEFEFLDENESYLLHRDNWIIEHPNYSEIKKQLELSFISKLEKERLLKALIELDAAILTDFLRESHGQRSHDYVMHTFNDERILCVNGSNISSILAKICLSHVKSVDWLISNSGLYYDENVGTAKVNAIYLSLVLRLADILDFDSDRTPNVLFKSIHFTSPVSVSEWQKHRDVKGWKISREIIRFSMQFEHPVYEKTANVFLDWIDSELNHCHGLIRKFPSSVSNYQLPIAEKVDRSRLGPKNKAYLYHDLEFTLSRDEIVKLLMTDKLYKNPSLFIRELLQNSLDALRLRKSLYLKDGFEWKAGEISFKHYIDSSGQEVVECIDNGCGMDEGIVSKYLGKVGRSYYRSPEFERQRIQLKEKGVDFEPCSQFGIGFMSCFMVGDRIQIMTRKDYGQGKESGKPLIIEINGLGGLIVVKEGSTRQEIGTTVRVFTRRKPIFFDIWSDNIRLLITLQGYAMATEFPIKALCQVKGIEGELTIPVEVDKKKTFLESLGLKKIITIEVDLHEVNKNIRGFMRQSFLVDDKGVPCVENSEARWETKVDKETWKDQEKLEMTIFLKSEGHRHTYSYLYTLDEGHSVCLDGILVCGSPGRAEHSRLVRMMLGHRSSIVTCEHPFTIDVRGNIKPELNPAREPLGEGGFFDTPTGWSQLQNLVTRGSGKLWERILNQTESGLSHEVFWRLIVIHAGSLLSINCNLLFGKLFLPVERQGWVKISELASFSIEDENFLGVDSKGKEYVIRFSDELTTWSKVDRSGIDLKYQLLNLLASLSRYDAKSKRGLFLIRNLFESHEVPGDNLIASELSLVKFVPFVDLAPHYITTTQYDNLANSENPLVKIVYSSRYIKSKNEIQEFAKSLVFNVCYLIQKLKKDKKPFVKEVGLRSLKYTSILFFNIDWGKYSDDLKPPYKIFVDAITTIEITTNDFSFWAKQNFDF